MKEGEKKISSMKKWKNRNRKYLKWKAKNEKKNNQTKEMKSNENEKEKIIEKWRIKWNNEKKRNIEKWKKENVWKKVIEVNVKAENINENENNGVKNGEIWKEINNENNNG